TPPTVRATRRRWRRDSALPTVVARALATATARRSRRRRDAGGCCSFMPSPRIPPPSIPARPSVPPHDRELAAARAAVHAGVVHLLRARRRVGERPRRRRPGEIRRGVGAGP